MARKKVYEAAPSRVVGARQRTQSIDGARPTPHVPDDARVDMVALLGEGARFAAGERVIDLSGWLGRGIDAWIWASAAVLRALLMSGTRQTATVSTHGKRLPHFFRFLTEDRSVPRAASPSCFTPQHLQEFASWLRMQEQLQHWGQHSVRNVFTSIRAVLKELFAQGDIADDPSFVLNRVKMPHATESDSRQDSLSDAEQERLAGAIKRDLTDLHHGRLKLRLVDAQSLRLLLIAQRQGLNLTPLLELRRDAMTPGLLPGTVRIRTIKHRSKRIRRSTGRAAVSSGPDAVAVEHDITVALSEGAVLQQAIAASEMLVAEAPLHHQNRVWLYRSGGSGRSIKNSVTCLTPKSLQFSIQALVERHDLRGDDGSPLKINLSRMRKSYFERAFRLSDGDLLKVANLMGNTPQVAGLSYATMSSHRKAEAASFMSMEFTALMRHGNPAAGSSEDSRGPGVLEVRPPARMTIAGDEQTPVPAQTAVARCTDTLHGEYAPGDGSNHCDRYVMCFFCPNCAVVSTVEDLWRLFSFQAFAREELAHLDAVLGLQCSDDEALEDLRRRYRLTIAYIDEFTRRQFPAGLVAQAHAKTAHALHPYWVHLTSMSRAARYRRTSDA
jgi:hypothetical protein